MPNDTYQCPACKADVPADNPNGDSWFDGQGYDLDCDNCGVSLVITPEITVYLHAELAEPDDDA